MKNAVFCLAYALGLALTAPVLADEDVKIFHAGSAQEMLNSTKKPGDIDNQGHEDGALKIQTQCTDRQGRITSRGQAGYEDCLRNRLEDQKRMAPKKRSG